MTADQIIYRINYNENAIANKNKEINDNKNQIARLEHLREQISHLQSNFESNISDRKKKVNSAAAYSVHCASLKKYCSGMNNLLGGARFVMAYNGLSEAKRSINSRINRLVDTNNDYYYDISLLRRRNEDLQRELTRVMNDER